MVCAGIVAVLTEFDDPALLTHIGDIGAYFLRELKTLSHPGIVDVRGSGLMLGIELRVPVTPILKALQDHQVIAIPAGSSMVRFLPPYIVTKKEVDTVMEALKKIFSYYV